MLKICTKKQAFVFVLFAFLVLGINSKSKLYAQSAAEWYGTAQERIDTLRKGNFGFEIYDKNGQPYTGDVTVRHVKHEYPFGIAFDLYEDANANNGNVYSTSSDIVAAADAEIYQSERWSSFIAYALPVETGKTYTLTLKFAEIYHTRSGARIFDAYVEGTQFLKDFDMYAEAGNNNTAVDTSLTLQAGDDKINIIMASSADNAAIKGMVLEDVESGEIIRINCGGGALTTTDGNEYVSDVDYFDMNAPRYPTNEDWMKAAMQKYFNYGASGNSFKWSGIQPQPTPPNYTDFDRAVEWTQSIGWELRAHTLLWGGYEYEGHHEMPQWVKDLPTVQARMDTCEMRVKREVNRYKGIIKEYDVMNEPVHATYFADSLVGDSINWECFKWAREADPEAELFINEYNVELNWGDAEEYRDLILKILDEGGPVTGVGMQAHFWECCRPVVSELVNNINIIAETGLPIRFTEYDYDGGLSEPEQASDMIKVMKVAFSHPSVTGMIFWGLSDNGAWRENSGLFDENNRPKVAADSLWYYTKELWTTRLDTTLSSGEQMVFNGYYGDYEIVVPFGDTVKVFTIPCMKEYEDTVFVLSEVEAEVKGPEYVSNAMLNDNTLKIVFDSPIDPASVSPGDFKFFAGNDIRILSVKADPENSHALIITLQESKRAGDYLAVSYFPGTLASATGGKAKAFGPETVENKESKALSATVVNSGKEIEVVFDAKMVNLQENVNAFSVINGEETIRINGLNYKNSDSTVMVCSLVSPVSSANDPVLRYVPGTLKSTEGFGCDTIMLDAVNVWPVFSHAEVDEYGKEVTVVLKSPMENVEENLDSFSVYVDDQEVNTESPGFIQNDSVVITFTLESEIDAHNIVALSYQSGTIINSYGNKLEDMDKVPVTNNTVTIEILNAAVINNGYGVEMVFNAEMINLQDNISSIMIADGEQDFEISSISYKDVDSTTVICTLSVPVSVENNPVLSYTEGTLISKEGYVFRTITDIPVQNTWPEFISAGVNSEGTAITAVFEELLDGFKTSIDSFIIAVDGLPNDISEITVSRDDSTIVSFTVTEVIPSESSVRLSYDPGSVKNTFGNYLQAFSNVSVTNNSLISGIEESLMSHVTIYPNPAKDRVHIQWDSMIEYIAVFNNQGQQILLKKYDVPANVANLDLNLEPGNYFIKISNNTTVAVKKIIIE